jgi:ornithine carbamoyltransferase
MPINLKGRSLLSLDDVSASEIRFLLRLAADLKSAKLAGSEQQRLKGRNIALIFEKDSTRTRTGFEVAAYDQGAHVTYLGPSGSQIGHKESMKDTARVLGRMYDAIEFRGYSQRSARELAEHSGVPVYNGLTDEAHPTQALADFMTMREFTRKHLSDLAVAFMGDVGNNVARSLALGGVKLGMDMRLCGPKELWPERPFLDQLERGLAEIASRRRHGSGGSGAIWLAREASHGCDDLGIASDASANRKKNAKPSPRIHLIVTGALSHDQDPNRKCERMPRHKVQLDRSATYSGTPAILSPSTNTSQ